MFPVCACTCTCSSALLHTCMYKHFGCRDVNTKKYGNKMQYMQVKPVMMAREKGAA